MSWYGVVLVAIAAAALSSGITVALTVRVLGGWRDAAPVAEPTPRLVAPPPVEAPVLPALTATIEGLRLATQVVRAGAELGQELAPAISGSLRTLVEHVQADRPNLRRVVAADGTVTLMFSDIEGSTALNEALGDDAWLRLLGDHDDAVRHQVRAHRGEIIKTQGDSFMVAFRRVPSALECAVGIQRAMVDLPRRDGRTVRVRIGLHTGEVTKQGRDLFGLNVALAARVAAEASGGEILVSAAVREAAGELDGTRFGRRRTVRFKGISDAQAVYPVRWVTTG